jgi:glycopeptide antibiotics resistance protein
VTARNERVHRVRFSIWTALIVVVVVPWASFVGHIHWDRIAWIPFVSPPVRVGDIVRNFLLYLPWGYLYVRQTRTLGGAVRRALAYGLALSVATEATQLLSHSRFPSCTDVTCNVAGAWIGARWAYRRAAERRP